MAQGLTTVIALAEASCLVPSTDIVALPVTAAQGRYVILMHVYKHSHRKLTQKENNKS